MCERFGIMLSMMESCNDHGNVDILRMYFKLCYFTFTLALIPLKPLKVKSRAALKMQYWLQQIKWKVDLTDVEMNGFYKVVIVSAMVWLRNF